MGPAQPRVVGVIQARMGSTRLPGKALADLGGRPVLEWVIEGARLALEEVVVATTRAPEDAAIVACAQGCGVATFAGSAEDVLGRVFQAARRLCATVAVRLTADCPFLDPALVDAVVARHLASDADLTTNDAALGGPPRGFDVEAIDMAALEDAHLAADATLRSMSSLRSTSRRHQREHVTPFLLEHPETYRIEVVSSPPHLRRPDYRLCVDAADDLRLCREIVARLGPSRPDANAIVALLDADPALAGINGSVRQEPVEVDHVQEMV